MKKSLILLCAALTAACAGGPQDGPTLSGLNRSDFQSEADGKKTDLFVLKNDNGMEVCVTNFGGRIVSVMVPGRDGVMRDVVLGFDKVADYQTVPSDFGATIGRYANRIAQGRITLDGTEYQLPQNNYGHCLHGGPRGFQYRVFDAVQKSDRELELTYASKDGEEGFPGNFECRVTMTLTDDNAIDIRYAAETDKTTVVNMTNHSYFNLDGDPAKDNSEWLLTVNADSYTPVDSTFMTTGEIAPVEGTPMDFRTPTPVGERIDRDFEQLRNGHGIDHNWVLNTRATSPRRALRWSRPPRASGWMSTPPNPAFRSTAAISSTEASRGRRGPFTDSGRPSAWRLRNIPIRRTSPNGLRPYCVPGRSTRAAASINSRSASDSASATFRLPVRRPPHNEREDARRASSRFVFRPLLQIFGGHPNDSERSRVGEARDASRRKTPAGSTDAPQPWGTPGCVYRKAGSLPFARPVYAAAAFRGAIGRCRRPHRPLLRG